MLCQTLGVALVATDADLRIRVWNAAAARMFGAAADRMINTPLASVLPVSDRATAESMLRRAIEHGHVSQFDFEYHDAQGNRLEVAATIAPVVSDTGQRIGASVCFRDITRRIELAERLEHTNKMAALGEMAGAIAHHFNNILGGIVTRIDFAKARGDSGEVTPIIEPIGKALGRAMGLVHGLLAFSEGDRRAEVQADLTDIIREVATETESTTASRGIDFTLSVPELPAVPMTRSPVATILRNVIKNAVEAMPHGGSLRLEVSVDPTSAVLRVSDTGVGLTPEARSRIFEPFWTTKGVLAEGTGRATGMGLAVAHGLTQMIGGSIAVESEPGKGSTFTIRIPRAEST